MHDSLQRPEAHCLQHCPRRSLMLLLMSTLVHLQFSSLGYRLSDWCHLLSCCCFCLGYCIWLMLLSLDDTSVLVTCSGWRHLLWLLLPFLTSLLAVFFNILLGTKCQRLFPRWCCHLNCVNSTSSLLPSMQSDIPWRQYFSDIRSIEAVFDTVINFHAPWRHLSVSFVVTCDILAFTSSSGRVVFKVTSFLTSTRFLDVIFFLRFLGGQISPANISVFDALLLLWHCLVSLTLFFFKTLFCHKTWLFDFGICLGVCLRRGLVVSL